MDNEMAGAAKCFPSAKLHGNGDKWNSGGDKDEESEVDGRAVSNVKWHVWLVRRDINVSYISLMHAVL